MDVREINSEEEYIGLVKAVLDIGDCKYKTTTPSEDGGREIEEWGWNLNVDSATVREEVHNTEEIQLRLEWLLQE